MRRDETRKTLYKIFDFIDGSDEYSEKYQCILAHPALYFFHSKKDLDKKIEEFLSTKDVFDKYDIYYFASKMIKFLLHPYDSHTKILLTDKIVLPVKFKVIDNKIYIIKITEDFKETLYSELISINGIDIKTIKKELEEITCYSTKGYLDIMVERNIIVPDILKSLPSFDKKLSNITYTTLKNGQIKEITFDLNKIEKYSMYSDNPVKNYTYKQEGDVLILVYNTCKDMDAMKKFISKIKYISRENNINKFIVDLRGNDGGNSMIVKPLIEFLKGKQIITLTDDTIFSSGRMACADLYKIGSYFIGTEISTSFSAFGNNPNNLVIDELNLKVNRSTKYFKYDKNFNCQSFNKHNFKDYFKNPDYFRSFDPIFFKPDKYAYKTLDDYKSGSDYTLAVALHYFALNKNNKTL